MPGTDNNIGLSILVQEPRIVLIEDIITRRIRIDCHVIAIFPYKETCIIDPTQGNHPAENIWMLQEEIERMIGPHTATCRHHWIKPARLMLNKRNSFANDITLISPMHFSPIVRVFPVSQPTLTVHTSQVKN